MPYFITDESPDCPAWAVVKEDGEVVACHETEQDAIDQMVAISIAEDMEPGGTYQGRSEKRAEPGELVIGDFVEWDSSGGMARGRIEHIMTEGVLGVPDSDFSINATEDDPAALIRIYRIEEEEGESYWHETETLVGHRFSTLTKIEPLTRAIRQVNLVPPAYMRAAARQGLRYYEQGLAGDGLADRTVTEARQMARGDALTPDKWVRIAAWVARHLVDLDAPSANPDSDDYPSPGVVAHLLWGSGPSKRAARRAMEYAEGVVGRIEAENQDRSSAKGEAVKKLETRTRPVDFEIRELEDGGLRFEGYAAVFNSRSEDLGGFTEFVAPGAFKRSLRSRNDVKLLFDHNPANVLASTRAGTMTVEEDARGLKVTADLAPTTLGRDVSVLVKRGDIDSMSFGFSVIRDSWNDNGTERTLHSVRLLEASIVSWPAYTGTAGTVSVRGLDRIARSAEVDADQLADAILKLEEGADMSIDDVNLLSKVIDQLKPEQAEPEATPTEDNSADMLALKKKKIQLLELLNG